MITTGPRRSALAILVALGALALAGCASASSPSAGPVTSDGARTSLEGTGWVLATYARAGGDSQPADADAPATLLFSPASRLTGSTGCNTFGGTWTQDGSGLTLSTGPTTTKACPGDLGTQETAVLADLQRTASYSVVSGVLRLSSSDGTELLSYLPGLTDLDGTAWTATGINNGKGGVTSVPTGVVVTAEFGTDGMLAGTGGCNAYSATWNAAADGALDIGSVTASLKGCSGAAGTTEGLYFAALDAVTSFTIEGKTLTLRDAGGATQVTYQLA